MCYFCGQGCVADAPSFRECPDKEDASKEQWWLYNHYETFGRYCPDAEYKDKSNCKCKLTEYDKEMWA